MLNCNSSEILKKAAEQGIKLGLERIRELCSQLGDPQNKIKIIHVAGTNGKGSFCAMLGSVLTKAGFKTGSFTSPALLGAADSFRINSEEIAPEKLEEILSEINKIVEKMEDKPTEFEIMTAAAFLMFYREKCDIAIVECGLGGTSDSTNIIRSPLLSVITNIQRDHTGILGNTLSSIAMHKAGIIKRGRPVLLGGFDLEAFEVINNAAVKKKAPLTIVDHMRMTVTNATLEGTEMTFDGFGQVFIPLLGRFQIFNTANVISAVELLREQGLNIPDDAVINGIAETKWHSRFEVICDKPCVIFDGAHNPDGFRSVSASIHRYFRDKPIVLLIGVMADKEYRSYPEILGKNIYKTFAVEPENPRALDCNTLASVFNRNGIASVACTDFREGVKSAYACAEERELPLVALGSLYMYRQFVDCISEITAHSNKNT